MTNKSTAVVLTGNCLTVMADLPDNSVDAIVTDPPYGLSFMSKKWDYEVPSKEIWQAALRVLKPGGHLLSFSGTRTYHRMVVNIEDAGFEIRDQIMWIYGSGFPKSMNLKGDHQGWGTALKPANEPICLARKPLEKGLTVAENVLKWGTGAINVDASRIATDDKIASTANQNIRGHMIGSGNNERERDTVYTQNAQGRWPANVLFDEEAAAMLDEQTSKLAGGGPSSGRGIHDEYVGGKVQVDLPIQKIDKGGFPSRFFYVAKASKRERGEGNNHPTVKPIKLMEYLIKLITPPSGIVLDPFCGSGSTGVAARKLNVDFIGIDMDSGYVTIATKRIESA